MHAFNDSRDDHERQDHERRAPGKAHEIIERAGQVGPYARRQHGAQGEPQDEAAEGGEQQCHILPFPTPAQTCAPPAEHSALGDLVTRRGAGQLATLAGVFAAVPLCDEAPLTASAIHARVALWGPHCIRATLRDLVAAGVAETSDAPAVHRAIPAKLYRRAPARNCNSVFHPEAMEEA